MCEYFVTVCALGEPWVGREETATKDHHGGAQPASEDIKQGDRHAQNDDPLFFAPCHALSPERPVTTLKT